MECSLILANTVTSIQSYVSALVCTYVHVYTSRIVCMRIGKLRSVRLRKKKGKRTISQLQCAWSQLYALHEEK